MIVNSLHEAKQKEFSHIGKETLLNGHLIFSGTVFVSGQIEGEVKTKPDTHLILNAESKVSGKVICENIEIYGDFSGEIVSEGTVILHSSSRVNGKIFANQLQIFPGAEVDIDGHTKE